MVASNDLLESQIFYSWIAISLNTYLNLILIGSIFQLYLLSIFQLHSLSMLMSPVKQTIDLWKTKWPE